jgi:DNA-binding PucR family transcriptional regulator
MNARRVAGMVGRRAGTTVRHRAVALLGLLSSDPVAAVRFVEAELGELAEPSDSAARLRATLRIYLDENASPARTSRRLGVNKNTVVYRVNKAEEMLGHPLAERRSELDAALRLAEALEGLRTAVARSAAGQPIQ